MRPSSRFRRLVPAVAAASLALGAAAPAAAEECPAIDPPAVSRPAVRAFIDPATGRLRPPTPDEARRLVPVSRNRAGRVYDVVVRPDGTRVVELDETFFSSAVAVRQPDGKVTYRCVTPQTAAPEAK